MLAQVRRDAPEAYVPEDRRRALAEGDELPTRCSGAALFADVSGFTAMTEALVGALGRRAGADALTEVLDRVFGAVLDQVRAWGGSTLYFSGDAVTCWFDGDDGSRALSCAGAVQDSVAQEGLVAVPGGGEVQLHVKVAVAVGRARRFVVGDPSVQLIDVLAGALLDRLAAAEQAARPGEVLLDPGAAEALGARVRLGEPRATGARPVEAVLVTADPPPAPPVPGLDPAVVRPWLLPPVLARLEGGGALLAELRPAVPVFVRFGGLDHDRDAAAQALDDFVVQVQRAFAAVGGNVLQLSVGDKGAYLYAVVGSPVAHEDSAARACAAALEVVALEGLGGVHGIQVGIASGLTRSGTYGSDERRTFCCLGAPVNLAARLMSSAEPGTVCVSEQVARAAGHGFGWEALEPVRLKGLLQPVERRRLVARSRRVRGTSDGPLLGRSTELAQLLAVGSGVVLVEGEAGVGTSRLVAAAAGRLTSAGVDVVGGEARAVDQLTGYPGWREVWTALLDVEPDVDATTLRQRVDAAVEALDPGVLARVPLLAPLLGRPLADTALTATFSPELRKASLEDLLVRLLKARAALGPVVVVLEDAHWLDDLGRDLLGAVVRAGTGAGVLISARPDGAALDLPEGGVRRLRLEELDAVTARHLVVSRLRELTGSEPPSSVVDALVARGQGNPFVLEQLAEYVVQAGGGSLPDAGALARLDLPDSLARLVLSRVDALPEGQRRTVRVASVVGRAVEEPVLVGAYPELGDGPVVHAHLDGLVAARLLAREAAGDYLFPAVVTREVAYESLPEAVRAMLHGRVGRHLETAGGDRPGLLGLLAHHYGQSDVHDKKRHYLVEAGGAAAQAYANEAAVGLFARAVPLLAPADRAAVLLRLGAVQEASGAWAQAEATYREALALAAQDGAAPDPVRLERARTALAEIARKQGRFAEADALLTRAGAGLRAAGDPVGLARVLHLQGTLASQQGDYASARRAYRESLAMREDQGDAVGAAALLSNLALVAENEGDLRTARELGEQALARRTAVGDRWGAAVSQTNLGMLALLQEDPDEAAQRFAVALEGAQEVGDGWLVVVAQHNLANAARLRGDRRGSAEAFRAALAGYRERSDRWSTVLLLEDLALLVLPELDRPDGLLLVGAADALRAGLGTPRPPAGQEQLARPLAGARAARGDDDVDAGHRLDEEQAVALALAVCARLQDEQAHDVRLDEGESS